MLALRVQIMIYQLNEEPFSLYYLFVHKLFLSLHQNHLDLFLVFSLYLFITIFFACTSNGISIQTGPGLPSNILTNATPSSSKILLEFLIEQEYFVDDLIILIKSCHNSIR